MRAHCVFAALLVAGCNGSSTVRTAPSASTVARACAFDVSCTPASGAPTGSECATDLVSAGFGDVTAADPVAGSRALACASSRDCASVRACLSADHGPSYCAAHVGFSCDGDTVVYCADAS